MIYLILTSYFIIGLVIWCLAAKFYGSKYDTPPLFITIVAWPALFIFVLLCVFAELYGHIEDFLIEKVLKIR